MAELVETGGNFSVQEKEFHRGLAEATGNNALKNIYVLCEDLLRSTQYDTVRGAERSGVPNTAVTDHQAILDALRDGNERQAEEFMQVHLNRAYENLRKH